MTEQARRLGRLRRRARGERVPDDGRMPLADHLRELRNRIFKSAIAVVAFGIVGWIFYDQILDVLLEPIEDYKAQAEAHGQTVQLTLTGITSPFTLKLNVAMFVGLVAATPVWTYQLWAFLRPGLHRKERRYTLAFVAAATPLFFVGVALAYLLLPSAIELLYELTPDNVANLPTVQEYLGFVIRLCLAFGVGFLMPVVVVGLNFAGVLTADRLRTWWRGAVLAVFVFCAIVTPTPDPWNMTLLALPMLLLLLVAWAIAWWNDRRKAARLAEGEWSDEDAPIAAPRPLDAPDEVEAPAPLAESADPQESPRAD